VERWEEDQIREDRRAALSPWMQANMNRDKKKRRRPYPLEDFMPHAWPSLKDYKPPRTVQTPEQQRAVLANFAAKFAQLGAVRWPRR
jgi:hypothetical protein